MRLCQTCVSFMFFSWMCLLYNILHNSGQLSINQLAPGYISTEHRTAHVNNKQLKCQYLVQFRQYEQQRWGRNLVDGDSVMTGLSSGLRSSDYHNF